MTAARVAAETSGRVERMRSVRPRAPLLVLAPLVLSAAASAVADVDPGQIFFPVQEIDSLSYGDSYGDPRGGGRSHLGVDLMAEQMTPVFAARDGEILDYEDRCDAAGDGCSYQLLLRGDDARMYFYVHLNEDTPGRPAGCDHAGGVENAYAPRLHDAWQADGLRGLRVRRGEHLGWVGSSGNAGCGVDHLHFEVWEGDDWSTHRSGSRDPLPIVQGARDAGNVHGPEWPLEPAPRQDRPGR